MKSKQGLLQLADRRHRGDGGPGRSPASPVITDSTAQMAEPQTCNNSIKLTFLCFHKVRHTQGHPLEFLTHSEKTNIAVRVRTAVRVCCVITKRVQAGLPPLWRFYITKSFTYIDSSATVTAAEGPAGVRRPLLQDPNDSYGICSRQDTCASSQHERRVRL